VKAVKEWTNKKLNGLAEFTNGFSFKPTDWGEEGKPIIRIQNLNGSKDFNYYAGPINQKYEVQESTLLFAWSGNRGTSFGPYVWKGPIGLLNQHIFKVVPSDEVDQAWFYYALDAVRQRVERDAHGAIGLVHVRREDLVKYQINVPNSTAEQAKIAEILTTVDRAIEQTEALIAKQQRIKAGLMQDLLTRGIDEHGNLRSEQTHKFKYSPLGRIPVEWEARELGTVAFVTKLAGFEFTNYFDYRIGGDIIALRALNIKNERLDLTDIQRIPRAVSEKLPRSKIHADDILITYIGAYIGDVLRINENDKYHLAPNIAKIVAGNLLVPEFLEVFLRSSFVQRQIKNLTAVTATPSLTMTQIRKLLVAIPKDANEQGEITIRIDGLRSALNSVEAQSRKLRSLKTALMQDLLTGKKRITLLLKKEVLTT